MIYFDEEATVHFFQSKDEQLEKYRQYGYISAKAKKLKSLYYKCNAFKFEPCEVMGYLVPANKKHVETCLVIKVGEAQGMVHKDYLKEMQEMKKKFDQTHPVQNTLF